MRNRFFAQPDKAEAATSEKTKSVDAQTEKKPNPLFFGNVEHHHGHHHHHDLPSVCCPLV